MKTHVYLTLLLMLIIGGCVPSLHQLWTKETLVYDDAIKGKYQESDNVWEFAGDPQQKSYALTIHEKGDKVSQLTAHLVEVQGQRFLDMYPSDDTELEGGDWLKFHLVPAHLFLHVTATEPNLVLAAMNPDEIGKLLKQQPELVEHEIIKDDRVVLTDSPEHLQKFLLAGLKIERFFGEPSELKPIQDEKIVTP
jgi:hypothetical protein